MRKSLANDGEPLSVEAFQRLPEENCRMELVRGWIVREPLPQPLHGRIVSQMGYWLEAYAKDTGRGVVLSNAGFVLSEIPATVRGPDVAFVEISRLPVDPYDGGFWRLSPDLAIEVVSPSNTANQIQEKVLEYLAAGSREVWVVDPPTRTVAVHRAGGDVRVLHEGEQLEGGDVLPGFSVQVGDTFRL